MAAEPATRLATVLRYGVASALGHLVWETLQLPLYTIWYDGTAGQIAYAVLHCTGGDLLIAGATLLAAVSMFGRGWPAEQTAFRNVAIAAIVFGIGYTVFSEWLNVHVRAAWTYSPLMPLLPPLGTGLSPVLQWIAVPVAGFAWARPRTSGSIS